jgi:hypothetical protein
LDFDPVNYSSLLAQLARPAPNQRHSLCHNLVDLKTSGMHCSADALAAFYAALPNLASLNLNCYHLPCHFFNYLYPGPTGDRRNNDDAGGGGGVCYLPKLETLTTYGIYTICTSSPLSRLVLPATPRIGPRT